MSIVKRLVFTEKATQLLEQHNKYIFEVDYHLTKIQICWLVEKMFRMSVENVNTLCRQLIINRMNNSNRVKRAVISIEKRNKIRLILCENEFVLS